MKKVAFLAGPAVELFGLQYISYTQPHELDPEKVSLFVLPGGGDISPALYGEKATYSTGPKEPTAADRREIQMIQTCVERGIPILGICRGAQLLCCLDGGRLYQHVSNHAGTDHEVIVHGTTYRTNSAHHQMMIPGDDAKVLGYTPALSPKKQTGFGEVYSCEPEAEIVSFPKMKALGIQGHPEWVGKTHDLHKLTLQLIEEVLWK